jgi:hypothetical protein
MFVLPLLVLLSIAGAGYGQSTPRATFDKLWIDYDVTEGGELGMRIHTKFTVYNMKDVDAYVAVYFKNASGEYLRDKNNSFNSTEGDVAVYKPIRPGYDPADFNDLPIFMPYKELDLGPGQYQLVLDSKLIYKKGGSILNFTEYPIQYSQSGSGTSPVEVSTVFKRCWIDYNVTENQKRGMRIHVNFEVTGLKGSDSKMVVRVKDKNNDYLPSATNGDELRLEYEFRPGYPTTVYQDAIVFLPYSEIDLPKGDHNLTLDIDVDSDAIDTVKHLSWYEFEFTSAGRRSTSPDKPGGNPGAPKPQK